MKVRVVSTSDELFEDRREAGRLLAGELIGLKGQNAVVLGIPRGGIIVAQTVARALDAELDIVLAHKLGSPGHEELAMGSVAEDGKVFLNELVVRELGVSRAYIEEEKARQLVEIRRRTELFRWVRAKVPLKGRIAIITDDGVATGATAQAAIWAAKLELPARLIVALPVGPEGTIQRLAQSVDEMICLRTPPLFAAVGQFYLHFGPVEDEQVLKILKEEQERVGNDFRAASEP